MNEGDYRANWLVFHINCNHGLIAHECLHMVVNILESKGIEFNQHTEEVYAYTLQWLFDEVSELFSHATVIHTGA